MGAFAFLLIPVLLVLFVILGIFLFAYVKVMQLWYKLTGRKPNNPFGTFTGSFGRNAYSYGNNASGSNQNEQTTSHASKQSEQREQRIFKKDEGEYVDFEIIDENNTKN